jgi:hypothetical protein
VAEPIVGPKVLGQPCWTDASLEATVRTVAAMGDESASRFLATHAPMSHIRIGDTDRTLTDASVYDSVSRLSARENVVLVHGAPGTGKSHLINWIKLRYEHALQTGQIANVLPILVRRRTGSLKDALEQLVEQLPEKFHRYLEPVQAAIDRISEREARKKLASELYLELGIRWEDAGKPPLPRTLRDISEIFHAEGFGAWLCREGGVIDRNIQRLISPSESRDRESIPEFTAEEFRITDLRQRSAGLNTQKVRDLIDEFEEELTSAEEAARLCNSSLRSALRELTGLGNAALSTILRSIRQDLRKEGQRLVLLIEDVSTLSVLDDEVVNAVEPQDDASLCDLTSVLGMTEQAYQRLRDNQYQRIAGSGLILSFPKDAAATSWAGDQGETDRFNARYLNAARLPEDLVAVIADQRRAGGDVSISACDDCPVRDACHAAFGTVAFGEAIVGLFPFRPGTASYLLEHLDASQTGVRPTQRGMLDHVTKPVLRHIDNLAQGERHPLVLAIRREQPADWLTLSETYLGGWAAGDKTRLRMLAEAWTTAKKASEIASDLKPLLQPFGFPSFSANTAKPSPIRPSDTSVTAKAGGDRGSSVPMTPPPPTADAADQKRLTDLLNRLDRWMSGQKLEPPADHQEQVLALLKKALPIDDIRRPAVPAQKRLREAGRGAIRIQDAATRATVGVGVTFDLPRSTDSYDLLVALTHQSILGRGSWNFPQAERYKRVVARWLRKHEATMLAALDPPGLSVDAPVKQAAKFLALAAVMERRAGLPADTPAALALLISNGSSTPPTVLTEGLRRLYADLPERRQAIRTFLVEETSVPQGLGGINVIDPLVITEAITEARSDLNLAVVPNEYFQSHWKSRFHPLDGLKNWVNMPAALAAEREALGEILSGIDQTLARFGFRGDYQGLKDFVADTAALIDLLKGLFRWPASDIGFFRTERIADRGASLANILSDAKAAMSSENDIALLVFDPKDLQTAAAIVQRCDDVIDKAAAYSESKHLALAADGDPDLVEADILRTLDKIKGVVEEAGA